MKHNFELELAGKLEQLSRIGDFITDSLRELGVDDKTMYDLQMAVEEACAKIITHGYAEQAGKIWITIRKKGRKLLVTIADEGTPFDPTAVPSPELEHGLDEQPGSGGESSFITTLVDAVSYEHKGGKNVLTMVKQMETKFTLGLQMMERLIIFSIIGVFALLMLLSLTGLAPFRIANDDLENARNILEGVGVEGLSAIFAIVISLTLMAVQFASQQYTHRIMDLHIKSLTFWSVVLIYLGSLLYNVFMLGTLAEPVNSSVIEISMLLTALCFILLVPYFFITMIRLRPEYVISNLMTKLDASYLSTVKGLLREGETRIPGEADKMLPITEIIEKSIGNGDRGTARFGLGEIYKCYMADLRKETETYTTPYFLGHILGIGREAIIEADDDTMVQVLEIFGRVGTRAIAQKLEFTTKNVLENIDLIGFKVLKDYDIATQQMIDSLQDMLRELITIDARNEELMVQIFTLYQDTADELYTLKKYRMVKYLVKSFAALFELMAEKGHGEAIDRTGGVLEKIGIFGVNLDIRDVIHQAIHLLHRMGVAAAKSSLVWQTPKGELRIAERIIDHLLKIEGETLKYKSKSKEFDIIINEIEYARKDIEQYLKKEVDFSDLWA
jgi:serine/threonine-protein kinase RsbW